MIGIETFVRSEASLILRGVVLDVRDEGIVVGFPGSEQPAALCDVLLTGDGGPGIEAGQAVLVWFGADPGGGRPVVLGRIGLPVAPPRAEPDAPDELVLEAKKNLTLRCGDGSITIREDGKILIKGKDLVSHARRVNRIKGGSVAIN